MGVTLNVHCATQKSAIDNFFRKALDIMRYEVNKALSYLGEQCVARVRDRTAEESWIDHTGNLRSSIGYAVYDYGKKFIESKFKVVLKGKKGASEGKRMVNELASQYANVYALVVVAGMNYADRVEAIEGKDVLASTESWARPMVNDYVNKAVEKAVQRINSLKI